MQTMQENCGWMHTHGNTVINVPYVYAALIMASRARSWSSKSLLQSPEDGPEQKEHGACCGMDQLATQFLHHNHSMPGLVMQARLHSNLFLDCTH